MNIVSEYNIDQLVGRTSATSLALAPSAMNPILFSSCLGSLHILCLDMAHKLEKRKRREEVVDEDVTSGQLLDEDTASEMHNILRRHFEAAFEPLADHHVLPAAATNIDADGSEVESGSDWDGISEGQSDSAEVIIHAKASLSKAEVPKEELKTFMVSANSIHVRQHSECN